MHFILKISGLFTKSLKLNNKTTNPNVYDDRQTEEKIAN